MRASCVSGARLPPWSDGRSPICPCTPYGQRWWLSCSRQCSATVDLSHTGTVVHEASRDHVFHGVTGRLVHRHLVRELAAWPRTRQHFAHLGQTVEIKTLQFACAGGRRVGGGSPPFDED